MSTTTNLNTLVINYLTEAQYEAAVSGGAIDSNQLYLTPEVNPPVTDVEVNGTSVTSGGVAEITIPTYTAGMGINISNEVISFNLS